MFGEAPTTSTYYRTALPYFGSVGLWHAAARAGGFCFRENETYQRRTQRNRCVLATAQGRLTLSVPLTAGKHEACPIRQVGVAYGENWRREHWQAIVTAYGSAPFWEEYSPDLERLYARQPPTLWDWNLGTVAWVNAELRAPLVLTKANDFLPAVDKRKDTLGEMSSLPVYPQVFTERTGFVSNASVLDLLLCQGPAASDYLSRD